MKPLWICGLLVGCGAGLVIWLSSPADSPSPALAASAGRPTTRAASSPVSAGIVRGDPATEAAGKTSEGPGLVEKVLALNDAADPGFAISFKELVERDPSTASALVDRCRVLRQEAIRILIQNWPDIDAAEAWAQALPDPAERDDALTLVAFHAAEKDPGLGVQIAMDNQLGDERGTLRNLARQWADKNFGAAEEWAHSLPVGAPRDQVFANLATVLSGSDPAKAAEMAAFEISPGPVQEETAVSVIFRWASQDAEGARQWAARFPEGALRTRVETEIENVVEGQRAR